MDFEVHYTESQEAFRAAVQAWLEANAPRGLNIPPYNRPLDPETQAVIKQFRRKLGDQGWLAPSWPQSMGGGGLSPAFEVVIREELRSLNLPPIGDNRNWIPAMMVWGTEEQRRRYVVPALRGETITWQAFAEPGAGTDLSAIEGRAVREGNEFVITAVKGWVTGRFDPDYLWTLAVTEPDRPQRFNMGIFMVDARSAGVTIKTQNLLMGSERVVYYDNVRVPAECLVGTPYIGWEIVQTMLEQERGGYPFRVTREATIESAIQHLGDEPGQLGRM